MAERSTTAATTPISNTSQPAMRLPGGLDVPRPSSGQLLWLGGLGAMAAFELIEWPVALVAAAATYVAEQRAKSLDRSRGAAS